MAIENINIPVNIYNNCNFIIKLLIYYIEYMNHIKKYISNTNLI